MYHLINLKQQGVKSSLPSSPPPQSTDPAMEVQYPAPPRISTNLYVLTSFFSSDDHISTNLKTDTVS